MLFLPAQRPIPLYEGPFQNWQIPPTSSSIVQLPARPFTSTSSTAGASPWSALPAKKSPSPSRWTRLRMKRLVHSSTAGSPVSSRACLRKGMSAVPPVPRFLDPSFSFCDDSARLFFFCAVGVCCCCCWRCDTDSDCEGRRRAASGLRERERARTSRDGVMMYLATMLMCLSRKALSMVRQAS